MKTEIINDVSETRSEKTISQGHPTSVLGKYLSEDDFISRIFGNILL